MLLHRAFRVGPWGCWPALTRTPPEAAGARMWPSPPPNPFTHSGPLWSRGSTEAKRLCSEAISGTRGSLAWSDRRPRTGKDPPESHSREGCGQDGDQPCTPQAEAPRAGLCTQLRGLLTPGPATGLKQPISFWPQGWSPWTPELCRVILGSPHPRPAFPVKAGT